MFRILLHNIDCVYSLEPPRRGGAVLTCTHNIRFEQKFEKSQMFSNGISFYGYKSLFIVWASFRNHFRILGPISHDRFNLNHGCNIDM